MSLKTWHYLKHNGKPLKQKQCTESLYIVSALTHSMPSTVVCQHFNFKMVISCKSLHLQLTMKKAEDLSILDSICLVHIGCNPMWRSCQASAKKVGGTGVEAIYKGVIIRLKQRLSWERWELKTRWGRWTGHGSVAWSSQWAQRITAVSGGMNYFNFLSCMAPAKSTLQLGYLKSQVDHLPTSVVENSSVPTHVPYRSPTL